MIDEKTKAELAELKDGLNKIQMWVEAEEYRKIENKVLVSFKDFKMEVFNREISHLIKS